MPEVRPWLCNECWSGVGVGGGVGAAGVSLLPAGEAKPQVRELVLLLVPMTRHRARALLSPKDRVSWLAVTRLPSLPHHHPGFPLKVFQAH